MSPTMETALLQALSLSPTTAKVFSHGGSGFASTYRISMPDRSYFVKVAISADAATQFEGEHASLKAIHDAVPSLCPQSYAWGRLTEYDAKRAFLATEFVDMSGSRVSSGSGSGMSLAQKLAQLHCTRVPQTHQGKGFGFAYPTYCGDTKQENAWKTSWSEFFANNKLRDVVRQGERDQGSDPNLRRLVEEVCIKVVPRLLGDGHLGGSAGITPALVHGDLWSGNQSTASFPDRDGQPREEIIFDPSSFYAHHEYDHGIMTMFGGFGKDFWSEYFCEIEQRTGLKGGKTDPVEEYADRVSLYRLFHQLNHWRLFGGGYKNSAINLLSDLVRKNG